MSQLSLIIKNEYLTDLKSKSFWIATFALPIVMFGFGIFIGFLADDSNALKSVSNPITPDQESFTPEKLLGMMLGMFLAIFLMIYGAQIFNKVKTEKCNRIVEIISTCVDGRTMMLAKIISVGLVGLTQLLLWGIIILIFVSALIFIAGIDIPFDTLAQPWIWTGLAWSIAFFIAGYVFYGSMFAAVGAMTDKNNENQEYLSILTFILLGSFYIGMFAIDHTDSALTTWCAFIPFTSPVVGTVKIVSGESPIWMGALSLITLVGFASLVLAFSGKIYTSSLLLKGKKFSPRDIITFLKSK